MVIIINLKKTMGTSQRNFSNLTILTTSVLIKELRLSWEIIKNNFLLVLHPMLPNQYGITSGCSFCSFGIHCCFFIHRESISSFSGNRTSTFLRGSISLYSECTEFLRSWIWFLAAGWTTDLGIKQVRPAYLLAIPPVPFPTPGTGMWLINQPT